MWMLILILFVVLLTTQIILNLTKIWDYIEMLKTAKKTAKIMNDTLEETLNGVRKEEDDGI